MFLLANVTVNKSRISVPVPYFQCYCSEMLDYVPHNLSNNKEVLYSEEVLDDVPDIFCQIGAEGAAGQDEG
jgi:hypothetical protein